MVQRRSANNKTSHLFVPKEEVQDFAWVEVGKEALVTPRVQKGNQGCCRWKSWFLWKLLRLSVGDLK